MKPLALVLVVVGIVALIYGGIGYNRQKTIIDVGGIKATTTEHESIPIAPIVGGLALAGGIALLVSGKKSA